MALSIQNDEEWAAVQHLLYNMRNAKGAIGSGDWLEEAEAALCCVTEARKGPKWSENYTAYAELIIAEMSLKTAIKAGRQASSNIGIDG